MVSLKRRELYSVKKPLKRWNFSGKSFRGVLIIIFTRSNTEMWAGFNDGSMSESLGCGMTPVFSNISLVLRTISSCFIDDSPKMSQFHKSSKPVSYPITRRAVYSQVRRIVVWRVSIFMIDNDRTALEEQRAGVRQAYTIWEVLNEIKILTSTHCSYASTWSGKVFTERSVILLAWSRCR